MSPGSVHTVRPTVSPLTPPPSLVFEEPEAPLALAALGGLSRRGRAECKGHLTGSVRGRESGQ